MLSDVCKCLVQLWNVAPAQSGTLFCAGLFSTCFIPIRLPWPICTWRKVQSLCQSGHPYLQPIRWTSLKPPGPASGRMLFCKPKNDLIKVLKCKVIRMISSTALQTVPNKFIQTTLQNEVLHILFSLLTFQWFRAAIDRHRTKDFAHVVLSQTHMARTTHMLPGINLSQPETLVLPWDARHCIAGRTQTRAQGRECQKPSSAMDDQYQSGSLGEGFFILS